MPIINRDGDNSEKKEWWTFAAAGAGGASYLGLATGLTIIVGGPMPYPFVISSIAALALGASGSPQLVFALNRNINSGGNTSVLIGISNYVIPNTASLMPQYAWSGLAPQGSTLLVGSYGDYLVASTAVASTACTNLLIQVVVKKTQDIVSHNTVNS